MDNRDLYLKAIQKFGIERQLNQLQEECGELISVINQYRRKRRTERDVCSEIADVYIMLNQMHFVFSSAKIDQELENKIAHLKGIV